MGRWQTILILALAAFAHPAAAQTDSAPQPPGAIDPDIAEATLRYQFKHNASGQQARAHVNCIGYGTKGDRPADPPPGFLARLSDITPPVKPYSRCRNGAKGVTDRDTGKLGLIFTIGSVQCDGAEKCTTEGGYYEGRLSSSGDTYSLERRHGHWIVVRDDQHWIS